MQKNELAKMLITLAKDAIKSKLYNQNLIDKQKLLEQFPNFSKPAATFVTLNLNGKLRGCIGSLVAHQALLDDLLNNAAKAAFEDPRFPPLTKEEFESVEIEISLLSQPLEIHYSSFEDLKSKINHGIDGVVIRQGIKQATFLPQVWEQLPDFEDFMTHLFHKANIVDLVTPIDVFVYNIEKITLPKE